MTELYSGMWLREMSQATGRPIDPAIRRQIASDPTLIRMPEAYLQFVYIPRISEIAAAVNI
jgi:hypothetical protein